MLWNRNRPGDLGAHYRRAHELWLEQALRTGRPDVRIPTRRVRDGGFAGLMSRPSGRHWARMWWTVALKRVDSR
ncbi:MAG: hypothetical protein ACF8R7_00035 [Phycisphaerales bacterium JB039]